MWKTILNLRFFYHFNFTTFDPSKYSNNYITVN